MAGRTLDDTKKNGQPERRAAPFDLEAAHQRELERRGEPKHYPMPESEEAAREWIKAIIARLRGLSFPTSPFSDEQTQYLIGAFESHLAGGVSLDIALGLRAGTKRTPEKHKALAFEADSLRKEKKTWNEIAQSLNHDMRELQKIHRRHEWMFLQDSIQKRLELESKARRWAVKLRAWRMRRMLFNGRTMAECEADPALSLDTLTEEFRLRFGLEPEQKAK